LTILLIHEYAAYVYGIADAGFRTISGSCPNPLDMVIGLHLTGQPYCHGQQIDGQ
jgi:hypothetical protein